MVHHVTFFASVTPDNHATSYEYDPLNRLTKTFDPENNPVSRSLDPQGRPRGITDANGNITTFDYQGSGTDGRLQSVSDAANRKTSFTYDPNGNATLVSVLGSDTTTSRSTLSVYDELDRATRVVCPQYTDANLGTIRPVTRNTYDSLGHTVERSGNSAVADVLTVRHSRLTARSEHVLSRRSRLDGAAYFISMSCARCTPRAVLTPSLPPAPQPVSEPRSPLWLQVGLFLLIYGVLQWAYQSLRSSAWDPWFIHTLTVRPAASLIDWVSTIDAVTAVGPRLTWPGGRLTLLAGCDGFEVMCLFVAAMLVAEVPWKRGLVALALGCLSIWVLNQLRIAALYAAFRYRRDWFDAIHTAWGPLLLIAAVAAIFAWAIRWSPWSTPPGAREAEKK